MVWDGDVMRSVVVVGWWDGVIRIRRRGGGISVKEVK